MASTIIRAANECAETCVTSDVQQFSLRDALDYHLDPCRIFLSLLRCLCLFIFVLRFLRTLSAYIAPAGASVNGLHAVA